MEEFDPNKINEYRNQHESSTEWKLREAFLMAHYNKLPHERLVCLASCFVNIECYGCRYPPMVMEQMKELMEDIQETLDDHRNMSREELKVKFVKASATDESESGATARKRGMGMTFVKASDNCMGKPSESQCSHEKEKAVIGESGPVESAFSAFVMKLQNKKSETPKDCEVLTTGVDKKSCADLSSKVKDKISNKGGQTSQLKSKKLSAAEFEEHGGSKFSLLSSLVKKLSGLQKNAIETLHQAADKCQTLITCNFDTAPAHQFACEVLANHVTLAKGIGANKKQAKHIAYEKAVAVLMRPNVKMRFPPEQNEELHSPMSDLSKAKAPAALPTWQAPPQQNSPHPSGLRTGPGRSQFKYGKKRDYPYQPKPLSEFIILQPKTDESAIENSVNIMRMSADFNHMLLDYDFREAAGVGIQQNITCRLLLQHSLLATAECISKTSAKAIVSQQALRKLRETQWTIQIQNHQDSDTTGTSREEILGQMEAHCQAIPSHNIGNKLLQKMGWSGGGIGKEGTGIAVPVSVDSVIDRQGLGLSAELGASKDFQPKIRNVISDYARSDKQSDFVLSAEFSKEERAVLHKEAQKLGLKTRSYGTGVDRYLVISRKRTATQLFEHIMKSGGTTSKYNLLAPQNFRQ